MSCSYLFFSFLQLCLQENLLHAYFQTSGTHNQEFHISGEQHKCERAIREGGIDSLGADCRTVSNGPTWDNELIIFTMNVRPSLKFFRLLHKGDNFVYLVYNVSLIIL